MIRTEPRRPRGRESQGGVALFQTLLIVAMLAIVALGFSQRTQDHLRLAGALEDRTRAAFLAESALQEALFVLLTESPPPAGAGPCPESGPSQAPQAPAFNRYGAPFCLASGVRLSIQDLSGLLPAIYPEHPLWPRFLIDLGIDEEEQRTFLGTLGDFQDLDRRSYLVSVPEPERLPSGRPYAQTLAQRPSLLRDLTSDTTFYTALRESVHFLGPVEFNPHFAPEPLLKALFGPSLGEAFSSLRLQGQLDTGTLQSYAPNLGDPEVLTLVPLNSPNYQISASASVGAAEITRDLTMELQIGSLPPFEVRLYGSEG